MPATRLLTGRRQERCAEDAVKRDVDRCGFQIAVRLKGAYGPQNSETGTAVITLLASSLPIHWGNLRRGSSG